MSFDVLVDSKFIMIIVSYRDNQSIQGFEKESQIKLFPIMMDEVVYL